MTCIIRVGSTSCVPGSSVGSGRRAGWKPCICACWGCGCSGAATPSAAPSSVLWAVPLSIAARTSRSTMRPAGPEPSIFERSRSFSSASLRTMGEALKCPSARPSACTSASFSASSSSGASVSVAVACAPPPSSSPPSSASSSASPPPSLRSGTSSPSPWINAIASPTGTSWPSSAISWASVPPSSASSSIVTLSVSISAMGSPSETSSPSLLSHLRRVPSSIASPILGIMTSGTLLLLLVQNPAGRVGNLLLAGECHQLEVARVRSRDLGAAHTLHRSVERIEGPILDNRRHLARHPEPPPLLLDSHGPVRLLYGLDDGVLVEGPQRSQVYDLRLEAILGKRICGPQAQVDLPAVGDERNVRTFAGDASFAKGYCVVSVFHFALRPVQGAGFQEDHGVGVPDSREHHALDVVRGHWRDDLETGEVTVEALQGVRVLGRELHAATIRASDHERHLYLSAREIAHLGGVLDDLVRRQKREVPGHHLDYRTHPHHRHADRRACKPVLGDGHVHYPPGPVLVVETVRYEVSAAVDADVLAHEDDALVIVELVDHRLPQGLAVGLRLRHGLRLPHVLVLAGVDVCVELLLRRLLALIGELHGLLYPLLGLALYLLELVFVERFVLDELVLDHRERIALAPLFDLFFGAVLLEEVGRAVRGRPVGERLDRVRLSRLPYLLGHHLGDLDNGLDIHAVHLLVLDAVGVKLGRQVGHGCGALDRCAHPVLVVLDDEQARALAVPAPEPGEVGCLVESALAHRTVPEIELGDVVGLLVTHGVGDANPRGYVPADDAVAAHKAALDVEEVHGATLALYEARSPAVELGHDLLGIASKK